MGEPEMSYMIEELRQLRDENHLLCQRLEKVERHLDQGKKVEDLTGIVDSVDELRLLHHRTGLLDQPRVIDILAALARDAHPAVLTVPAKDFEAFGAGVYERIDKLTVRVEKIESRIDRIFKDGVVRD